MNTKTTLIATAALCLLASAAPGNQAWAQSRSIRHGGTYSIRASSRTRSATQRGNATRSTASSRIGSRSRSSSSRGTRSSGRTSSSGQALSSVLSDLADRVSKYNGSDSGRGYDDRRRREDYRYGSDREYARAYRDAAIAQAVAEVISAVVIGAQQQRCAAPAAPAYQQQNVLVREGYYRETRVWVPDAYHPATGTVVKGHYEVHRQWVPPVYETRTVQVLR